MWQQDSEAVLADMCTTSDPDDHRQTRSTDSVTPVRRVVRSWVLEAVVAAYSGDAHRLLTELADALGASVAYVDRLTVEAHLERPLTDHEWSAVAAHVTAMAFDEHVGDAGTVRTDWIEGVLVRAGVPGRSERRPTAESPKALDR
jgi:hypothetical protein